MLDAARRRLDPGAPEPRRFDLAAALPSGHDAERRVRGQDHVDAPARPRRAARRAPGGRRAARGASSPPLRYVQVTRRDKVAQAVSLWRAVQTRAWRAGDVTEDGEPVYHARRDRHLVGQLADARRRLARVVRRHGIEPLTSSTRSSPPTRAGVTVRRCSTTSASAPAEIPEPPLRRQGDDRSARWVARFTRRPHERLRARRALEAEAVYVMREVAAEFERPVLLFSGGKDSIVLLRLAEKAFRPGALPVPGPARRHGHNFPEVLEFRDRRVEELGEQLIVASVQESIDAGARARRTGAVAQPAADRRRCSTRSRTHGFDAAFGGARRDEERARAKERVFSFRDELGQWDPRAQRPGGLEPLQRPRPPRRERARVPALELDRARRLALHRARGARGAVDLLRPRARGVRARRDAARRVRVLEPARRRGGLRDDACATARSAT